MGWRPDMAAASERYLPLAGRAAWAKRLLLLGMALDAAAVLSGLGEYSLLQRIEAGEFVTDAEANANDLRQFAVGVAQFIVFFATVVVFLRWFHRAYRNLPSLGAQGLHYGRRWAIGSWFVPILNLFRPKQIANDIWRASDPELEPDAGARWTNGGVPALFACWWAAWLVSNFLYNASLRLSLDAEELSELVTANVVTTVADAVSILAGALAFMVVRRTTKRQDARAEKLATLRGAAWEAPVVADAR
jgi:hypothetical protein